MLDQHYHLKADSIGIPKTYLGSEVKQFNINDDPTTPCWAMSSEKYVKNALRNLRTQLEEKGLCLKTRAPGVLPSRYRPELDTMPYCDEEEANY